MRTRTRAAASVAAITLTTGALTAAAAGGATPAGAATTAPSSAAAIYQVASPLPYAPAGTLIRYAPVTASLGAGNPAPSAWTVQYHSRDSRGHDDAVTGTVLRPTAPWAGPGARPVVSFGVGTQGMSTSCAPSKQLQAGTEYEASGISQALQRGWAVVVTDDEGYTNGATPTYVAGRSEGHAVLDMVRAARQVPGAHLSSRAPTALWGYSQGGGATGWAAVLQPGYAKDVPLVGSASGGIPADLKATGEYLDGHVGEAFLLYSVLGLATAYPDRIPLYQEVNDKGRAALAAIKTQCVSQSLAPFAFHSISEYTKGGKTLRQLEAMPGTARTLAENNLTAQPAPRIPVLQYHGLADEIVPLPQALTLHRSWCARGVRTSFVPYGGEHISSSFEGAPLAVQFLADRFAGKPFTGTCPV